MNTLTHEDLNFVVRRLPKDIVDMMRDAPIFLGGGFIRETIAGADDVRDIDLFGPNKKILSAAAEMLAAKREVQAFSTKNAVTVLCPPRMPVQFITRWCFDDVDALVASFDFTVCQAAIWFDRQTGIFCSRIGPGFYQDLAARRLVYTFPVRDEEAGGSMLRVRKFLQRGYSIQALSLAGVMSRLFAAVEVSRLPGDDEKAVARVLAGLLREVDPLLVVDGLEPIDEHEKVA